ncbi:hypothetical protein APA_3582 [Pseudanabaena sp. lw0831]|uniref:tetratricopeptide repeat protein n=1 Tax=Pseudanabaena sp. lw0831 TaxID=1357935 RepID=UPI0019165EB0|nr:tetratricopeptide repeat protein [Pseudanabaena sp. lw0831]GBO55431.1 hypothetical protein APA_3582 [Pseudanabaena sp. lw0831]
MNQQLLELLHQCTVRLSTPQEDGTGFFVAPGTILTCAHVVETRRDEPISIYWQGQNYTATAVEGLPEDTKLLDLALLRLTTEVFNHPCVYLDEVIYLNDALYSYGYTDDYPNGDPATFEFEGNTGDQPPLLKFKEGQVRPGLSGSPLLNQRTGMVCGVVKKTRDRNTDLGGRGVPISAAIAQWTHLVELQQEFHQKDTRWKNFLLELKYQGIPENIPESGVVEFVGREKALFDLHQLLEEHNQVAIKAAITGMGGVGKTELAIQYARCHLQTYQGGVCWLQARNEEDVGIQIVNFAKGLLKLNPREDIDLINQVRFCWQEWLDGEVLVVLDDVVDYQQIQPFLPSHKRFKVLITTRKQLQPPIALLALELLSEEASLDLLISLVGETRIQEQLDDAKRLCRWLGYLPLGLELVGRYLLRNSALSLAKILSRLEKKRLKHPAFDSSKKMTAQMTAKLGVTVAFDLTWEDLDEQAQQLGCLLSLFALAPIPWSLVEDVVKISDWEIDPDDLTEESRDTLVLWNLLQHVGEETYKLHELIRDFFREKLEDLTQASNFKQSIANSMATLARHIPDTPSRQITQSITITIPHLTEITESIDYTQFDDTLYWLFVGLARFYNGQGFYTLVEKWCEQGLSIIRKRFNTDKITNTDSTLKEVIAALWLFQGKALRVKGEYSFALEKYQQSIKILQDGQEKTMVVRALRGQGHVYRLQGKHEDSIRSYEESRGLAEVIKFDKGVARAAYGVARIYRLRGELEKAALRYEEARVAFEKLDLPVEEAWATFGLGEVQRMRWILQQSYEMYSAALQQFKELGHREGEAYAAWGTGDTNRLLGGIEAEKRNLETALKYLETAKKDYELSLEICQQIGDRRSEAWAVLGLAEVSRMEGKYEVSASEKAISKYHDALSKYQHVFSLVSYQECVEEAHALLGIAATKRLLSLQGIISDSGMEINEACEKAINIYQDQNRNMNYCIVDALIERGLYHLIQLNWEQAQLDLEQAEKICINNNYTEEKDLINRIKNQKDSSELHILNFP